MKLLQPVLIGIASVILLVINIRVEAGSASVFERTVDGFLAGFIVVCLIFLAVSFVKSSSGKK